MPNRIGDVRYVVTWIDDDAVRESDDSEDDLAERLAAAERGKAFETIVAAKTWAEAHADEDHFGNPRLEKQIFGRAFDELPPEWIRSEYQEWVDGSWQPLET